jgi:cation-transporting ATPase E
VLEQHTVFGRVTPDQKRRMVTALQARGHVVAMTGDGVNDALAIKTADIGIAMNSGAAATKAVARLVLLDGRFSHLPSVVAEGRQVIANIERVSMLFLTKTVYATGLAVLFGALVMEFPFLPRQLSITDGLTIGIPAFFLALLPNTQRYVPGFLRRSLSFAIPAGLVIAVSLTLYTRLAMGIGLSVEQLRTGATIILAIVAIWVLTVLSRPVTRVKVLVIGAMFIALTAIFTVPALGEFFQLQDPGEDGGVLITVVVVVAIGAIEVVRFAHRRFVQRSLLALAGRRQDETLDATAVSARRRPTAVSAAIVLVYVGGLINTALGIVVLLTRYGVPDDLVLPTSLVGAATVLLGLLTVAGGSALSRGSVLARNLLTAYLALLGVLQAVAMILTELDPVLTVALVAAVAVIVAIWVPAGSRRWFRPVGARPSESTPSV